MADMTELTENQKKLEDAFKKSQDSRTTAEAETAKLNAVSQEAYKQTQLENQEAQNQFAQNISANQLTALDAIRRSNASAIANGANAGLSAANQLSSILGLQQDTSEAATDIANTSIDAAAQLNTQLNENAVTGAKTANELNAALGANEAELAKAMAANSAAIADIRAAEIAAEAQKKNSAEAQLAAEQLQAFKDNGVKAIDAVTSAWDDGDDRTYPTSWFDPYTNTTKGPGKTNTDKTQKAAIEEYKNLLNRIKSDMLSATTQEEYNAAYKKYQLVVNGGSYDSTDKSKKATATSTAKDEDDGCVTPNTLITLANKTYKKAKDITDQDQLLVWDIVEGGFKEAQVLFVEHAKKEKRNIITLKFDNKVRLEIIDDHGLFNTTLMKYVYIKTLEDAKQYIGHNFFYITDDNLIKDITLRKVSVKRRKITAHSPCTAKHLCVIANNLLTMPGNTEPFTNVCKVDPETFCYDKRDFFNSVETYGLFSEKDFEGILPHDIFFAFQGPLLKIKMAKNETNMEEINKLIERYSEYLR